MKRFFYSFILVVLLMPLSVPTLKADPALDRLVESAIATSLQRLAASTKEVGDRALYPTYGTPDLKWQVDKSTNWVSGFYPGCLWYAYELSHDARFEQWAQEWTAGIEKEKFNRATHDLGFRFACTFGNGLRLGQGPAYARYKEILNTAAATLALRYDPKVGCLSSNWDRPRFAYPQPDDFVFNDRFPVVIDIMMNLELLLWSAENGGSPEWAKMAISHADITFRDFVRPDGGTYHVVRYNKKDGSVLDKGQLQGAGPETTWSRGHAWALYGMVVLYRYTKEPRFLEHAIQLSDYFIQHSEPDHVARWDFQSNITYRDVSATAITTSALFEMVRYIKDAAVRARFEKEAEAMLAALCQSPFFASRLPTNCLLDSSTQHLPVNRNIDVPAIFADYYFLEALVRYRQDHPVAKN